jgi:hypothetical protein
VPPPDNGHYPERVSLFGEPIRTADHAFFYTGVSRFLPDTPTAVTSSQPASESRDILPIAVAGNERLEAAVMAVLYSTKRSRPANSPSLSRWWTEA